MADASRYQLAGRAVARHAHRVELLTDSPKHVIGNLLALDGAMSEHLVTPDDVRAFDARERVAIEAATRGRAGQGRPSEGPRPRSTSAPSCSGWSRTTAGSRPSSG